MSRIALFVPVAVFALLVGAFLHFSFSKASAAFDGQVGKTRIDRAVDEALR